MRAPRIAATHQECKVVKVSMAVMALWFLLVIFATESNKAPPPEAMPARANEYCSAPLTSGDEGGSDVTSVTVVVRHGARSGIATDTQDWKCGLGALKTHIQRWEAASGNALTPETSNGACKKGQLVARGFRQHKRLGAFSEEQVWRHVVASDDEIDELPAHESVGERLPRRLLRRTRAQRRVAVLPRKR